MDAVENRVTVRPVQRLEEGGGSGICCQSLGDILGSFAYTVAFRCAGVNPDEARGTTAVLDLAAGRRFVTGVVESLRAAVVPSALADDAWFEARLAPLPYVLLRYQHGFRIYQELSVVEIAQQVFERAGIADQIDWSGVSGTYPTRTYTVQYDESEWDFVSRLFEEVGLFYAFEHDAAGHRMVVMDHNRAARALEPAALPFLRSREHRADVLGLWDLASRARIAPSKVSLRDFDFERPSLDLSVEASAEEVMEREHYAYPGYYTDRAEGARLAQVRLDAFRSERATAKFSTNVLELMPGHRFELTDHDLVEGDQLVTEVRLEAVLHDMGELGATASERRVEVSASAQPFSQSFRSKQRTPKPKVLGVQTAMVAGPPGEEIWVDRFGRVKVQFHWDRQGLGDDKASCWMRVTQQHTTGSIMIPRIGWEVLVEFIDGDPDRPVVLGRVWNPNTPPPHSLPASKTYSVHASVSSPGRAGTNEIVMDDAAGQERIIVNAQRNYALAVANNRMLNVGMNLATTVSANRTASIGANETKAVKGNEGDSVTGSQTIAVGGMRTLKVTGTTTEGVTGSMALTVSGVENIQVGSPAAALLEVVQNAAVSAATGAAAQAANRATAPLLAPLQPALSSARGALGPAAQLAGPAAALLGPADPNIASVSRVPSARASTCHCTGRMRETRREVSSWSTTVSPSPR